MNAFLLGATGLVGRHLLECLLASADYERVVAPVRRSTGVDPDSLIEVPFDAEGASLWKPPVSIDHAFIAFGTTRKSAGSIEAQWDIDVRMPRLYAERLRQIGVRHLSLCSSIGANRTSAFAYSCMKGQLEEDIRQMEFPSFATFRPSVLGGHRGERERRAEVLAQRAFSLLPKKWRTIPAERVARAMVRTALAEPEGMSIIPSHKIWVRSE